MSAFPTNDQRGDQSPALLRRLDHVAIAVRDTNEALRHFSGASGLSVVHVDELDVPPVTLTYLNAGNIPSNSCRHGPSATFLAGSMSTARACIIFASPSTTSHRRLRPCPPLASHVRSRHGRGRAAGFVNDGSPHGVLIECTLLILTTALLLRSDLRPRNVAPGQIASSTMSDTNEPTASELSSP